LILGDRFHYYILNEFIGFPSLRQKPPYMGILLWNRACTDGEKGRGRKERGIKIILSYFYSFSERFH